MQLNAATTHASPSRAPRPRRHADWIGTWPRRMLAALCITLVILVGLALLPSRAYASGPVGVKSYYLALGDSLAFGYEPNLDWSHGYAQQWYSSDLHGKGSGSITNYGCNGEKASTFVNGGCPYWYLVHNFYTGAQLNAAVSFLNKHPSTVSPVSLDIGANDLLPDINSSTCVVSATWATDLANVDSLLKGTILPKLTTALTNSSGQRTGDLVMMLYYDPYQNKCPNSVSYVQELNTHLVADGSSFGVYFADAFTAFGGATTPNPNICTYTWMCSSSADIHATGGQSGEPGNGYKVISGAFESATGY